MEMARPKCNTPLVVVVGLAYQGKDIVVFRFIIEYNSSLRGILAPR
jgi:hypothetical protein